MRQIVAGVCGLQIPGKTTAAKAKQVHYMIKKVKEVHRIRSQTGQGSLPGEIHGGRTTYGYDLLLPLVVNSVAIPLLRVSEEHGSPVAGPSRSHVPPLTDVEVPEQPVVEEQDVDVVTSAPVDDVQLPVATPGPATATPGPTTATGHSVSSVSRRVPTMTRTPRRIGQSASLLQELRGLQEQHDGLFLAAENTRREKLDVERSRVRAAEAELELQRRVVELEANQWQREMELKERAMQLKERAMEMKEKKLMMEFELEKRRLDLEERKIVLGSGRRGLE